MLLYSCDNSTTPLVDGYTLYGTVLDLKSGSGISSVEISIGYTDFVDSVLFNDKKIISDTLGSFVFKGGIGTAPHDEVFRFEHPDYYTKEIILRDSAKGANNRYTLSVSLLPR
jgi:hypothetical protein